MQGNGERGSNEENIRELIYTISFLRPLPLDIFKEVFLTDSLEFKINEVKISLVEEENFVKQIVFEGAKSQQWVDYFVYFLSRKMKVDDVIWSYEIYLEIETKEDLRKMIKIPSVLPLVGNVTNYGIVISNDPEFKMMLKNFTTVQIDKHVRVIKRSQSIIRIPEILEELEKLLDKIKT